MASFIDVIESAGLDLVAQIAKELAAEKVPFDSALFAEWVADQPELWTPLGTAILDAYKAHADKRDAAVKN